MSCSYIGVRDQFRLGRLRSVARIFSPLLARKSSGFARILPDFCPNMEVKRKKKKKKICRGVAGAILNKYVMSINDK